MTDVLATIGTAITLAKSMVGLVDDMDKAQLKLAAADLTIQLADLKVKLAELVEENDRLKRDLQKATSPPEVVVKDGVYFKASGDGPFCPACYDNKGKLIRLGQTASFAASDLGKHECQVCHAHFR